MRGNPYITLAHGGGGVETRELIENIFLPFFQNSELVNLGDAALLPASGAPLAVSTDSFVVNPIFFPGGDIGKLAVAGTVNDLTVSGAVPAYITAAFIIEEGFPMDHLRQIARSMALEAAAANAVIVAGDTKVVEKGKGDGVFITTTGVGILEFGAFLGYEKIQPGDSILINGDIGLHGLAVLGKRHGLELDSGITSDCASLYGMVKQVVAHSRDHLKFMRDPTRGGVAVTLKEIATASGLDMVLEESLLPISKEVRGCCDFLGYDPLYLANEGKVLLIVSPEAGEDILRILKSHRLGTNSCAIGQVHKKSLSTGEGRALLKTLYGGTRELSDLGAAQLPRIC